VLAGCGTGADSGGGAAHLPVSGGGPFRPLDPDPSVLSDPLVDLDDPSVIAVGDTLELWVTATRGKGTDIEHATAPSLDRFGDLEPALVADQAWEGAAVRGPSVLSGRPWLLFYSAAGAIGWAAAYDGKSWQKGPGPSLVADGAAEGSALGAPAAVRLGDFVRVYYPAAGAIWAAEALFADLARGVPVGWSRVDGDPTTPARDPMLAGAPFAAALGRVSARAAATPADRLRHDLYFTAETGITNTPTACGFAASFTGDRFEVAAAPILPLVPAARSPAMTPYRDGALLLYVQHSGVTDAIAAALSP
jgi:hypothetical protein